MSNLSELLSILTEMLEASEGGEKERMMELNDRYLVLCPETCDFEYENCRQSCVCAITQPMARDVFLVDARQRLSEILKYQEH